MANDNLNNLITALRQSTAAGSITPDSHGYILQVMADLIALMPENNDLLTLNTAISNLAEQIQQETADRANAITAAATYLLGIIGEETTNRNIAINNAIRNINGLLDDKVDKVSGKGLSTNDYTNNEKNKLEQIENRAQVNKIENVAVNNENLNINNKRVNINIANMLLEYFTKQEINDIVERLQTKLTFDDAPQRGSLNPVKSNGIYEALSNKQAAILVVELTKVNGTWQADKTFGQARTAFVNSRQVIYHDSLYNYYLPVTNANDSALYATAILEGTSIRIRHSSTGIERQSNQLCTYSEEQLEEIFTLKGENVNVLESMGRTLDNVDSQQHQIGYVANNGDYYYSESDGKIYHHKDDYDYEVGSPNKNRIYVNRLTRRMYIWNGSTFFEVIN